MLQILELFRLVHETMKITQDSNSDAAASRWPRWLAASIHALILFVLLLSQGLETLEIGGNLSAVADPFSESNALRAGKGFAAGGFFQNAGLPDVCYGDDWPNEGFKWFVTARGKRTEDGYLIPTALFPVSFYRYIYTHYPPGPDWILGILTWIAGGQPIMIFRCFPLLLAALCMGILSVQLWKSAGPARSVVMMGLLAAVPMFSNMMHGLHYQSYSLSLLLLEVALLLAIDGAPRMPYGRVALLFLAAHAQGWLSFDYCFLVAFVPIPIFLARPQPFDRQRWFRLALCVLVAGGAFALAHILHFAQVVWYYHDFHKAVADLRYSGTGRMGAVTWPEIALYFRRFYFADARYFAPFSVPLAVVAAVVLCWPAGKAALTLGRWRVAWKTSWHSAAMVLAAFVVSLLWFTVMARHGLDHSHFLPRNYFLFYFAQVFTVVNAFSVERIAPHDLQSRPVETA